MNYGDAVVKALRSENGVTRLTCAATVFVRLHPARVVRLEFDDIPPLTLAPPAHG